MTTLTFAGKIVAVDRALAEVPHAFGGAISLAYYAEPRATADIDLNVFVPESGVDQVASALASLKVTISDDARALIARDGQARIDFAGTWLDLFFAYDPFHAAAQKGSRPVPFADTEIPILSADHLIVCKAVFNRPKDWVDIDAIKARGTSIDTAEVMRWVGRIAGDNDARFTRIAHVLTS